MARSTYIYLIQEDNKPYAAFTVKHEMISYLSQLCGDYTGITILRMKDNPNRWSPEKPIDITKEVLEEEE